MAKRIVFFNHKGGVSQTTSAYNIGWMLSKNSRVLLVDGDPQCNLSSLILGENFEKYYVDEDTKYHNIMDGVKVVFEGKAQPIQAIQEVVNCVSPNRATSLHLLAGHANLSEYDAALTFAQTSNNAMTTLQNLPGAFSELIQLTEEKYNIDYTLIDLNPGLSAINQNLFLSSNAFIIPTNPDPFSLMAIDTLSKILPKWVMWKKIALEIFADSTYPLPEGEPKFIGCLIQRFNIRNGKATKPYRNNISEIKHKIQNEFFQAIFKVGMTLTTEEYTGDFIQDGFCLGEIPDFQGILPKSYQNEVPVFELLDEEIDETGVVLEGVKQSRDKFTRLFENINNQLSRLLSYV